MNKSDGFLKSQPEHRHNLLVIFLHLFVWLSLVAFFWTATQKDPFFSNTWFIRMTLTLSLFALLFYFNSLFMVPRYLITRRGWFYLLFVAGAFGIVVAGTTWIDSFFPEIEKVRVFREGMAKPPQKPPLAMFHFFNFIMVLGVSTSITLLRTWYRNEQSRLDAERQRLSGELLALRNQIHPHFFFNTLNNIYSLVDIDPSRAKIAVLEMSKLMRYLLYESEGNLVPLEKEVGFLKHYLHLMQLRLTPDFPLEIQFPEKTSGGFISPMMFIPIVENVFKYGVSYTNPGPILISLKEELGLVTLITENAVLPKKESEEDEKREKIGITNVKRRLELLYPNRHILDISSNETRFRVMLSFPVETHGKT